MQLLNVPVMKSSSIPRKTSLNRNTTTNKSQPILTNLFSPKKQPKKKSEAKKKPPATQTKTPEEPLESLGQPDKQQTSPRKFTHTEGRLTKEESIYYNFNDSQVVPDQGSLEDDTEADVSIPQEHSKLAMSVTSQTGESLHMQKSSSSARHAAVARVPVREIQVHELSQTVQPSSRASSGRASKVKLATGKVASTKNAANKTIRVPPPTINPCNTMSHLK